MLRLMPLPADKSTRDRRSSIQLRTDSGTNMLSAMAAISSSEKARRQYSF